MAEEEARLIVCERREGVTLKRGATVWPIFKAGSSSGLVYGQMNEPSRSGLRVALSALAVTDISGMKRTRDVLLFIAQHFASRSRPSVSAAGTDAERRWYSNAAAEMGNLQETHHLDQEGFHQRFSRRCMCRADDLTPPRAATDVRHLDAKSCWKQVHRGEWHFPQWIRWHRIHAR